MSLEQLIKDCKKNKPKAQEQLYQRYAGILFTISLKYCRNRAEAEDNLHDTFLTIFNKIEQYSGHGAFEGWLKRIAINTALQRYRQQGVYDIVNEENIKEVEVEVDEDEVSLDFLLSIIQDLPDRYRLVFNLYVLDGYSHKEISKMLNIAVGTSKSNLARARMILKEHIELYNEQKHSQTP
ncbi:RNA polymerase sigma factor [Croceiramulus getboli]|nr:RNA polymerase sigma factor [Flavobacteriaceae bacterium YJPT1-3]